MLAACGREPFGALYASECAVCHGEDLRGTPTQGPALIGADLVHGESVAELSASIAAGFPDAGMPGWAATLTSAQIQGLAIFVAEERAASSFLDFRMEAPLVLPSGVQRTQHHAFAFEEIAHGLDPLPYGIAPLPDGRILLTERQRGLKVVSAEGEVSGLVPGAPLGHDDGIRLGALTYSTGNVLDVALGPSYAEDGWIYLSFGDRCEDCEGWRPRSMLKVVRARLREGRWVDEQTLWEVDEALYTTDPDMSVGGRITFDGAGHVFVSLGMKDRYRGVQSLGSPLGKIHRFREDGRVPDDNPFAADTSAFPTVYTLGHRSPQGLEFDPSTGRLWQTEMGPRGGDEVNLLEPGRNYGWPLTSKGVHYDGRPVDGVGLGISVDRSTLAEPVVDFTPSVAVSSFVVYRGAAFPDWEGDLLVGSLKATDLIRLRFEGTRVVEREVIVDDLARVRDVEVGPTGEILLLLEHEAGGRIVRLVPAADEAR